MTDAKLYSFEAEISKRLPPFRMGTLEIDGNRVRLKADVALTPSAARTLAAQLVVLAESLTTKVE